MDVVSHGPVPNDPNGYYLVRSFASLAELTAEEDGFYGSTPWRRGAARRRLVSRIETYVDTLLWLGRRPSPTCATAIRRRAVGA